VATATAPATSASSVTSACTANTPRSAWAGSPRTGATTRQPSATSRRATAVPSPPAEPVTSAVPPDPPIVLSLRVAVVSRTNPAAAG
jgi:hypothetical protein